MRAEATKAVRRGERGARRPIVPAQPAAPSRPVASEDVSRQTESRDAAKVQKRLADAARAFERQRYADARKMLKPLAERVPGAASVRELHGLTLYRLQRWKEAARELEAFRSLTAGTEQHPVLADCYRALQRWDDVDALWEELRAASPGAGLVAEGRIVTAGSLAERGRLADAVRLLERAPHARKRPKEHHLRVAYALADLYERAGDTARARELFRWVSTIDPGLADVGQRLSAL